MMSYQIGYWSEGANGKKWGVLKQIKRATDAEAEAEVNGLFGSAPLDDDGCVRVGLYVKRGSVKWFVRFSHHLIRNHPKRPVND